MSSVINYPTDIETSVFTRLRFVPLPKGTRVPPTYTITTAAEGTDVPVTASAEVAKGATTATVNAIAGGIPNKSKVLFANGVTLRLTAAAASGATSLQTEAAPDTIPANTSGSYRAGKLTAGTEFLSVVALPKDLHQGEILTFGSVEVTVTDYAPVGVSEIDILPLSEVLTPSTSAQTRASLFLAGITDASPSSNPKLVDATNFNSGAGNEQLVTGTNRTLNFAFQRTLNDPGADALMQILYDDRAFNREIHTSLIRASGELYEGACIPTTGDQQSPVQDKVMINCNLQFQGGSFKYEAYAGAYDAYQLRV
ncbi:MAG: hypothetical protein AAFY20_09375 [Cyanobacteria bacterium J06639_14]